MTGSPPASRVFSGIPPHASGQTIGLYGGTFNPAHEGHRQVSLLALRRLGLDRIWWLVTPGNPLKDAAGLPPLEKRMAEAARVASHPSVFVSGVEAELGTRYTSDLIRILKKRAPNIRFVWIMGGDNLAQFHRWENWREIAAAVPIAVVNRPGHLASPLSAVAAQALAGRRLDEADARALAHTPLPAWTHLTGPRTAASSSLLRSRRKA